MLLYNIIIIQLPVTVALVFGFIPMHSKIHFTDRRRVSACWRNPWRIQIKSPHPCSSNLFLYPHLRPILANGKKKSASTCKIRKGAIAKKKKLQMQESSRNRVLDVGEECADGCSTASCGRPSPLLLLSHLAFFFVAASSHPIKPCAVYGCCKYKLCRLQQRLQWLFLKVPSL